MALFDLTTLVCSASLKFNVYEHGIRAMFFLQFCIRESLFNRQGRMKILRGGRGGSKNFYTPEGGDSEKIVGLGGGLLKFLFFKTNT